MVILPNGVRAGHPDTLNGIGRKVGWDEGEPGLNPEAPIACLNQRPCHPVCHVATNVEGHIVTKRGLHAHGSCPRFEEVPGKNSGAINSTCY